MAKASYLRKPEPATRSLWRQRELARLIAGGASPKAAAQVEGAAETMVERLVAEPQFQAMVDAYRDLAAMDHEQVLVLLEKLCRGVLVRSIHEDQDAAVCAWYMYTLQQGEDPILQLAESLWQGFSRAMGHDAATGATRRERPEPGFLAAIARSMGRVGTRLRQAVHREIARNALLARIDRKPLPQPAVDALIDAVDPPPPPPRALRPRRRPPVLRHADREAAADEAQLLLTLPAAERDVLYGAKARAGPRAGPG